jgi:hypothetical protein
MLAYAYIGEEWEFVSGAAEASIGSASRCSDLLRHWHRVLRRQVDLKTWRRSRSRSAFRHNENGKYLTERVPERSKINGLDSKAV